MPRFIVSIFVLLCLISCSQSFVEKKPHQAAIATAHPLATQAGFNILEQGGNAFDAAVAITAALAVVEPAGSGLGGGGFWLLHRASDQKQIMIDGRETAPSAAHRDMYLDQHGQHNKKASLDGPLAAGIPGVPAALDHISQHYGHLTLKQALSPAIAYAKQGFKVTPHYQKLVSFRLQALNNSPAAKRIFLQDGTPPQTDTLIKQADLALTLEKIAAKGATGFYQGTVAQLLVDGAGEAGGIWTLEDLANYQIKERNTVKTHYQDYQITSAALPSSGGIVLGTILNQLELFDLSDYDINQQRHLITETMRRAYFDRSRYLGDSDFITVPEHLTAKSYAKTLASTIDKIKATSNETLHTSTSKGEDTTHFSVLDQYGNRVSATLSINYPFGSAFVVPGTGVLLNDEMDDFSAQIGAANVYGLIGNEANAIAANKRPLSSMTPTFIENEDHLMIIGTPGGSRIITMVLLGILDFIEGKNALEIVSSPRFHHQYLPNEVQLESTGFSEQEKMAFRHFGHSIKVLDRQYGNMQIIIYDKRTRQLDAASDPRGEGLATIQNIKR